MPFTRLTWTESAPPAWRGGAVTVGNFDGVHLGHQQLIQTARRLADALHGPAVVVAFDPPPVALLNPARTAWPLTTLAGRAELLQAAGAEGVGVLTVDPGLLSLSPEAFFEEVIQHNFAARALVEGYNFRFGRGRLGDTHLLRQLCAVAHVRFEEVPPHQFEGEPVSSSRIRAALALGNVRLAARLLGRNYSVAGVVEPGAQRGRTIGFPTANLGSVQTLLPLDGVYAGHMLLDGEPRNAVLNLGPAPTFGEPARRLEVHLLDFTGDLYGRTLSLQFVERLRPTRSFASATDLTTQLRQDVAAARILFAEMSTP